MSLVREKTTFSVEIGNVGLSSMIRNVPVSTLVSTPMKMAGGSRTTEVVTETYVNGQTVREARLAEGNKIRVGGSAFTFTEAAAAPPAGAEAQTGEMRGPAQTLVFGESLDPKDTGQYTLSFLQGHDWGPDFFFLFQLSVKLLGVDDPDAMIQTSMKRLSERTDASAAGFLWASDGGDLKPKVVFPKELANELTLDPELTRKVVSQGHAIRFEYDTIAEGAFSDSICVPLNSGGTIKGAIHLYRKGSTLSRFAFQTCVCDRQHHGSLARPGRSPQDSCRGSHATETEVSND